MIGVEVRVRRSGKGHNGAYQSPSYSQFGRDCSKGDIETLACFEKVSSVFPVVRWLSSTKDSDCSFIASSLS